MAGSLCLPVCFIAVVYCLESIFVYQISILRMAGEGRVEGGCSSAVSRTKKLSFCLMVCRVFLGGVVFFSFFCPLKK